MRVCGSVLLAIAAVVPAAASAQRRGTVTITSVPVARVLVDGVDVGRRTPVVTLAPLVLEAGEHEILLVTEDGRQRVFVVEIENGSEQRIDHVFPDKLAPRWRLIHPHDPRELKPGRHDLVIESPEGRRQKLHVEVLEMEDVSFLTVTANVSSRIFIDGKDTGRSTPILGGQPLDVPPGKHRVELKAEDGRVKRFDMMFSTGETRRIAHRFK